MWRTISLGFVVSLLTGCAVFSSPATSSLPDAMPVSADELRSLTPGQWYRITNHDERRLGSPKQTVLIGRLERSDGNSITLKDVREHVHHEPPSSLKRVPFIHRVYEDYTFDVQSEALTTVPREKIQSIDPISAAEADLVVFAPELPDSGGPTADELRSLQPGEWYRITYPDERDSGVRTQREQIGKLERSDGNSILLTEVTTRVYHEPTSPLKRVPYINRLYKNTGIGIEDESKPWRIGREFIQSITPISAAEAAEWKQPFQRIGIDFDFEGAPNDEGRTAVMSHEKR